MSLNIFQGHESDQDDKHHPHYRRLLQPDMEGARRIIEAWANGFVDRDNKIVTEFRTTFWSSFWEFYLFALFKNLGFKVDFSYDRPDFVLNQDGNRMIAEAVVSYEAVGQQSTSLKIKIPQPRDLDIEKFLHYSTIRILNSLSSKAKKYKDDYESLEHVKNKPFILCIAPYEQPLTHIQNDRPIRWALYSYDIPIAVDEGTSKGLLLGHQLKTSVPKNNATSIDTGFFLKKENSFISAVLFSTTATPTKAKCMAGSTIEGQFIHLLTQRYQPGQLVPKIELTPLENYSETLLDGAHLFINPYATNPVNPQPFIDAGFSVCTYDIRAQVPIPTTPSGFLFQRHLIVMNAGCEVESKKVSLEDHQFANKVGLDCLRPVQAKMGHWVDHHMSVYKGWTILINRCPFDNDWGWIAVKGQYEDVRAFVNANSDDSIPTLIVGEFLSTKEYAFDEAKEKIKNYCAKNT
ncbi:MAG: hypothetical protein H6618_08800 [Deltaproteobacteria bacterium]|nr:hypothetical protein [Deltaproteobacteria bacterium]